MTQFGRALLALNIDIICANSPQAKGRIERALGTLHDRMVKELRLAGSIVRLPPRAHGCMGSSPLITCASAVTRPMPRTWIGHWHRPMISTSVREMKEHPSEPKLARPVLVEALHRSIDELIASGAGERTLKAGDIAPLFVLPNADGKPVSSKDLLVRGPLVVTLYRGIWCPTAIFRLSRRRGRRSRRVAGAWSPSRSRLHQTAASRDARTSSASRS